MDGIRYGIFKVPPDFELEVWFSIYADVLSKKYVFNVFYVGNFTLKVLITTAADDKFCDIFPNFQKNKV